MKVELENVKPMEIEKRSFEIITEELGDKQLLPGTELIVKRCIHTSADFDYADNLCFSPDVVERAMKAIKEGACIVTDTQMAKAESINVHWPVMVEKSIVSCPMRMWQRLQKRTEPQGRQQAWTKLLLSIKN